MAKQSGIHQLRGKVGEMSYYRQTGVNPGLARRINQAMSERVKTGQEYANTRLLNAEFGQAGRVAGVAARAITPKFRPMILPFSQSKLVKGIYDAITQQTGVWGRRGLNDTEGELVSPLLNSLAKNDAAATGFYWSNDPESDAFYGFDFNTLDEWLSNIGATHVRVNAIFAEIFQGVWQSSTGKYPDSLIYMSQDNYTAELTDWEDNNHEPEFITLPTPPVGGQYSSIYYYVFVIMPLRTVGSQLYTLQEHCTFVAIPRNTHEWGSPQTK